MLWKLTNTDFIFLMLKIIGSSLEQRTTRNYYVISLELLTARIQIKNTYFRFVLVLLGISNQ